MSNKQYWFCLIGPADRDKLPQGCDGPIRNAVSRAFIALTGAQAEHNFSGWGRSEEEAELLNDVSSMMGIYPDFVEDLKIFIAKQKSENL